MNGNSDLEHDLKQMDARNSSATSIGKGSKSRITNLKTYKDNFSAINWSGKKDTTSVQIDKTER
jgi:hypothetical protein